MKRTGQVAAVAFTLVLVSACSGPVPADTVTACRDFIKLRVNHPSTVRFPMFGTSSRIDAEDGSHRVRQKFTARNAFNLKLDMVGYCRFPAGRLGSVPEVDVFESLD